MVKFLIIGAGWYGCMVALLCEKHKIDYLLLDKDALVFSGSSSKNQNRLHLGYHYPRSSNTIEECQIGYKRFMELFKNYTSVVQHNIYVIDKNSKVSFTSYKKMFDSIDEIDRNVFAALDIKLNWEHIDNAFLCNERYIKFETIGAKFTELFKNNISKIDTKLLQIDDNALANKSKVVYNNVEYDYLFNCTYGQSDIGFENVPLDATYELCLTLLYKNLNNLNDYAVTIIDGNYFSLYPIIKDNKELYTLTHVKYTPLIASHNIEDIHMLQKNETQLDLLIFQHRQATEEDVCMYIPNFFECFKYCDYYLSIKCKFDYKQDDRSLKTIINKNKFMFVGGKITGIFDMMDTIAKNIPQVTSVSHVFQ